MRGGARLLSGEAGARLRQIAHGEGKLQQVNRAMGWIKLNYDKSFSLERVEAEACMTLPSCTSISRR
ncbi:hypothetical protein AB4099_13650 [Bosea sp. 2KB_26]|uniref:hypothetical protein n=1 Tax=Bosea sp. 2KB_26 TaxID=3237475 RepID=UPI000DE1C63B